MFPSLAVPHHIMALSSDAAARYLSTPPGGTTHIPVVVRPWKVWIFLPLAASHRTAVKSDDPVRTCLPSRLRATLQTASVWPRKVWISLPLAASHRIAVLSSDPVRTCLPSRPTSTLLTTLLSPP